MNGRHHYLKAILGMLLMTCLLAGLVGLAVFIIRSEKKSTSPGFDSLVDQLRRKTTTSPTLVRTDPTPDDDVISTPRMEEDEESPTYQILLNHGSENSSGHVYIQYGDRLGFVCSDGFDNRDALVVCNELGYRKGIKYDVLSGHPTYERYTEHDPILAGLNCDGTETQIGDCPGFDLDENVTSSCTWFAAVVCYNTDTPYELRLTNNNGQDSGLVEMKLGGIWGVVCALRTFDDELADILCRNMNYTGGITMDRGNSGEVTNTNVWLPYISCDVGEPVKQSLFECNMILHTENILKDRFDFRSNRYINEYMACLNKPNSFAAAVHCLNM